MENNSVNSNSTNSVKQAKITAEYKDGEIKNVRIEYDENDNNNDRNLWLILILILFIIAIILYYFKIKNKKEISKINAPARRT